ncbi:MAG: ABC transporter permease [Lachnospiraceae bacterium]
MYKEKKRPLWVKMLLSASGIIIFLIIWELVVLLGLVSADKLVTPSKVIMTFFDKFHNTVPDGNTIDVHILASLKLVLAGFIAACLVGVPLGLAMGFFRLFNRFLTPIFEILRPIPPLAWIPIVIVLLGIGFRSKMFIIFIAAFVPCVINSYTGIKATPKALLNVAKTAGASKFQIFYKVGIPYALPMVFTGIKVSFGSAWATLVAAEMIASSEGLGYMIQQGRNASKPEIVLLGMLVIGLIGAVLTTLLSLLEQKAIPWRETK